MRPDRAGRGRGLLLGAALVAVSAVGGCTKDGEGPGAAPGDQAFWDNSPRVCAEDEAREYFCDELLPLRSALPAPEPYSNCPGNVEGHAGALDPRPTVAGFDPSYTAYTRKRMPPGNSCCYSWCAKIPVVSAQGVDPNARCDDALAIRETFCFNEPERGTSDSVNPPFERCPQAIKPPPGQVFQPPNAALFDGVLTGQKRQVGLKECCYAWCSIAPPGTAAPEG